MREIDTPLSKAIDRQTTSVVNSIERSIAISVASGNVGETHTKTLRAARAYDRQHGSATDIQALEAAEERRARKRAKRQGKPK